MRIYLADTIQRNNLNYKIVDNNLESYFAICGKLKRESTFRIF